MRGRRKNRAWPCGTIKHVRQKWTPVLRKGHAWGPCVPPRQKAPAAASARTGFHCPVSCARPLAMNRTGLVIALLIGAGVGLVLGLFPWLDLAASARFFDEPSRSFNLAHDMTALRWRNAF